MTRISGISVREKLRLAGRAKKEQKRQIKEEHLARYYAWFTMGLSLKVDNRSFASTELTNWCINAGLEADSVNSRVKMIIKAFNYVRVRNPSSKDGRHWKGGKSYVLYVHSDHLGEIIKERARIAKGEAAIIKPKATLSTTQLLMESYGLTSPMVQRLSKLEVVEALEEIKLEADKPKPEEPKPFKPSWML